MKKRKNGDYFNGEYENDPVGLMAAEIVVHAITDWRALIAKKAWSEKEQKARCNFQELRSFFKSDWCAFLMMKWDIEPRRILEMLEEELQQAMQQHSKTKERKRKK